MIDYKANLTPDGTREGATAEKTIRVLHVIKTLALGGAETNLLNLARAFDAGKIETHIAYSYGGEIEGRFRNSGAKLFKYADRSHRIKSLHTVLIVLRLMRYIARNRVDIVQTHNFNAHVWGVIAAKLCGAKVVEHVHDFRYTSAEELSRRHGLLDQYRFIRYFRDRSDRVVVLTRDNAHDVVKQGIAPTHRVREIQNGIPFDDAPPLKSGRLREEFAIPDDAVVIATSARMDPTKNIELILAIAARVVERAPKAVFVVAGNGAFLETYRNHARQEGLEKNVLFVGFREDMYALLSEADIFLLPSFLELHSIAILEALKMKLPVVVSSGVGCNDQFIEHGINGFLCDPFQQQSWIDALAQLANDDSLRQAMGARGYEMCRRLFDIEDTATRFQEMYAELVA
ncbi:MAG: glycosyltransferase [Betaproteobacteria bacterium]